MKVVLLQRSGRVYSAKRLAAELRRRGHRAVVVDPLTCMSCVREDGPDLLSNGRSVADAGVSIARFGAALHRHGTMALRQLELAGVPAVNSSDAIGRARDKLTTLQTLVGSGVPMPPTAFAARAEDARACIEAVGGPPVAVKSLDGPPGRGMMLARTAEQAVSLVEGLVTARQAVLVQAFLPGAIDGGGRALVVGEEVVAAVRRQVDVRDDVASTRQLPRLEPARVDAVHEELALAACGTIGLGLAAVDWVETPGGPVLIEVNAAPSFEAIEAATGRDVAGAVVTLALELAAAGASA